MLDYYNLISRAISSLPDSSDDDVRQKIYSRAKSTLNRHLSERVPPLSSKEIANEISMLEKEIEKIEAENFSKKNDIEVASVLEKPSYVDKEEVQKSSTKDEDRKVGASEEDNSDQDPDKTIKSAEISELRGLEKLETSNEKQPAPIILPLPPKAKERNTYVLWIVVFCLLAAIVGGALLYKNRSNSHDDVVIGQSQEEYGKISKTNRRLPGGDEREDTSTSSGSSIDNPRAFMVLEPRGEEQNQFQGNVKWRFVRSSSNDGSLEAAIHFPDNNDKIELIISKNKDASVSASHTMMIIFHLKDNVDNIAIPEWRERENKSGSTLTGNIVPIGENAFLMGFEPDQTSKIKNMQLMRNNKWMVFEFSYKDKRVGAVLLEKGLSGEKSIDEAIDIWQ